MASAGRSRSIKRRDAVIGRTRCGPRIGQTGPRTGTIRAGAVFRTKAIEDFFEPAVLTCNWRQLEYRAVIVGASAAIGRAIEISRRIDDKCARGPIAVNAIVDRAKIVENAFLPLFLARNGDQ